MKPSDYIYIEAYGKLYSTPDDVIAQRQHYAALQNAPLDTAYINNYKEPVSIHGLFQNHIKDVREFSEEFINKWVNKPR